MRHEIGSMFQFVTVSHPDQIKVRETQGVIRQHAIRRGIERTKYGRSKKKVIVNVATFHSKEKQLAEKKIPPGSTIARTPSAGLVDPFYTLCGSPERLRSLMRHRT